mmetsp:Transcript_15511/g.41593  ORF Transcript_15511/g.41593 Transcript_15511/m.41593 type:complete len:406 (-) Transcript_15511:496-1713(-)
MADGSLLLPHVEEGECDGLLDLLLLRASRTRALHHSQGIGSSRRPQPSRGAGHGRATGRPVRGGCSPRLPLNVGIAVHRRVPAVGPVTPGTVVPARLLVVFLHGQSQRPGQHRVLSSLRREQGIGHDGGVGAAPDGCAPVRVNNDGACLVEAARGGACPCGGGAVGGPRVARGHPGGRVEEARGQASLGGEPCGGGIESKVGGHAQRVGDEDGRRVEEELGAAGQVVPRTLDDVLVTCVGSVQCPAVVPLHHRVLGCHDEEGGDEALANLVDGFELECVKVRPLPHGPAYEPQRGADEHLGHHVALLPALGHPLGHELADVRHRPLKHKAPDGGVPVSVQERCHRPGVVAPQAQRALVALSAHVLDEVVHVVALEPAQADVLALRLAVPRKVKGEDGHARAQERA